MRQPRDAERSAAHVGTSPPIFAPSSAAGLSRFLAINPVPTA